MSTLEIREEEIKLADGGVQERVQGNGWLFDKFRRGNFEASGAFYASYWVL